MAYKDKEKAAAKKREWEAANPEKVKAAREAYNEKRRQRRSAAVLAGEASVRRKNRSEMTPEERQAVYDRQKDYQREWRRAHYAERYAAYKERMATDPEFAAQEKARQRVRNAKRGNRKDNETPEQRERRLQRNREYNAQKYREKKAMQALVPAQPKQPIKVAASPPPKPKAPPPPIFKRKPGRLLALTGWNGF